MEEGQQIGILGTCSAVKMGAKLSQKGTKFDGYADTASTLLARDYKGFGNQQMTGVIEKHE